MFAVYCNKIGTFLKLYLLFFLTGYYYLCVMYIYYIIHIIILLCWINDSGVVTVPMLSIFLDTTVIK